MINNININEKFYNDLLLTDEKSVVQVICDTEVLKEVYELLRFYIMDTHHFSNEVRMSFYSRLTEQIKDIVAQNSRAKSLYRWLYNKEFSKSDEHASQYLKSSSSKLAELRALVKKWDDDEHDGELATEAMMAAFRIKKNISSSAS